LAWIAAPVIAFFFAFIALFIVQNVFEQTVCQKTIYTFNRTTISQIEKEGLDVNHLSSVNGHKFYRELEVYKELKAEKYFMRSEILKIIRIAEVYPLKVDTNLLRDKGLVNRFSKEQWEALVKLEGREFKHKWQLKETLAKDPSWQKRKEITERDKLHNQDLEEQFNLLFRTFYFPPA
jgi:phosphate/sulfate permease